MASVKIIENLNRVKSITTKYFPVFSVKKNNEIITIKEVLPFKVKFINIGIPSYGPGNVPPIGIAVIGINNYIL